MCKVSVTEEDCVLRKASQGPLESAWGQGCECPQGPGWARESGRRVTDAQRSHVTPEGHHVQHPVPWESTHEEAGAAEKDQRIEACPWAARLLPVSWALGRGPRPEAAVGVGLSRCSGQQRCGFRWPGDGARGLRATLNPPAGPPPVVAAAPAPGPQAWEQLNHWKGTGMALRNK